MAEDVRRGEHKLAENSSTRAKSKVWEHFGVIIDEENNQVAEFAACKKCRKVLFYDSRKLGTSFIEEALGAKLMDYFSPHKTWRLVTAEYHSSLDMK